MRREFMALALVTHLLPRSSFATRTRDLPHHGLVKLRAYSPHPRIAALSHHRWLVVATVCVGAFMGQLDASIVTLALPTLEAAFHTSLAAVEWVAISYLLALAGLVVAFGRLADIVGRKTLYTAGFLVFIIGSALCGLSPSLPVLIAARVLQAVGAAMLQANSVALITQVMPRRELGRAIGMQGTAQAVGLSVGPGVGGWLIANLGWPSIFWVNVPAGLVGLALAYLILPQTVEHPTDRRFDWLGAALFLPTIACLLLALTYGNNWGWRSIPTVGAAATGLLLLGIFLAVERRARAPLIDFALFQRTSFSTGIVAGLLSYAVLFGGMFVFPFLFQRVQGHSAVETGLLLMIIPAGLGVAAPLSGLWADQAGARPPTVMGMGLTLVALAGLVLGVDGSLPIPLQAWLVLFGFGLGLFTPANNSAIMGSAPRHRLGIAGGVLNMTRGLGTTLGVALCGLTLTLVLSSLLGQPVSETSQAPLAALESAIRVALIMLGGLAGLAILVSLARGPEEQAPHTAVEQAVITAEAQGV